MWFLLLRTATLCVRCFWSLLRCIQDTFFREEPPVEKAAMPVPVVSLGGWNRNPCFSSWRRVSGGRSITSAVSQMSFLCKKMVYQGLQSYLKFYLHYSCSRIWSLLVCLMQQCSSFAYSTVLAARTLSLLAKFRPVYGLATCACPVFSQETLAADQIKNKGKGKKGGGGGMPT